MRTVKRQVLVVSHADADGHVIAEQVRRNLSVVKTFEVTTVVDPIRTKDHRAWLNLDAIGEIEESDLVFFVDLMFAPASFGAEADALVRFVRERPSKEFFVLDHHPLPIRRLSVAPNLRALYRQDVLDCTIGPSSWMMTIAALCEKQPTRADKKPDDKVLAKGVQRAAAPGGALPGEKLLALLRFNHWEELKALGQEAVAEHPMPRGRRRAGFPPSKALVRLDEIATELLHAAESRHHRSGSTMSYDFEAVAHGKPPKVTTSVPQANDLEAIMMLLELAAIHLTPTPGAEFSLEDLLGQARVIGGEEIVLDQKDAEIVLKKAAFLRKQGKRFCLR